jgi:hypothetical protein
LPEASWQASAVSQTNEPTHAAGCVAPLGRAVHVPTWPGIAHELHMGQAAEPQQTDSTQPPLPAQSALARHALPWAHDGQAAPPQSTSVSVPSLMPFALQTGPPPVPELEVVAPPVLVVVAPPPELEVVAPPVPVVVAPPPELELVLVVPPPEPPQVRRIPQSDES